ncbi:MFS transporter [Rhizocola hellebori]|uniref:MFS transporter n=1 Tax=Rhizocola hellebori TaxID=1392758 RepID=UPI00194315F4|nr:MFS transporter [Rhizocola hellebori]
MKRGALAVLRAPGVPRLLSGSLIGRLPLGAAPLALLLFARDTMSIAVTGILVGAYTAGTAVGQPLLSRIADRWRQPPVMWASVAVSSAGFAVLAARPGVTLAIVAAVLAGLGAPPFEACLRVLWKELVGERLVHAAYTLDVTVQELIFIVGPLVALGAIAVGGSAAGLWAAIAVQLAGTAVFASAPMVSRWRGDAAPRHWAGALRSRPLLVLLGATLLVGSGVGATAVAVTFYAEAQGARSWAGILLAAQATGALLGGLIFARRQPKDLHRALPGLVALMALGYLPLLLAGPLPIMVALLFLSGLMLPPVLTGVFITADRVAAAGTAAESFAWVATAFGTGSALGAALAGMLLEAYATVVIGFSTAPLVILAGAMLLRVGRRAGALAQT